jgi:Rrf2 family protein
MSGFMKISEAASLALHSMAFIAGNEGPLRVSEISRHLGASEFHLSKVLQRLGRSSLVNSTRGPRGGFTLVRKSSDISLLEVYEAIEGPLGDNQCLFDQRSCANGMCILGTVLTDVSEQIHDYLKGTTLSEISGVFERRDGGNQ